MAPAFNICICIFVGHKRSAAAASLEATEAAAFKFKIFKELGLFDGFETHIENSANTSHRVAIVQSVLME